MSDLNTILVAGDLHGDAHFTQYIFLMAFHNNADAIVQVGDFGLWEHMHGGSAFLDVCSELATGNNIPLYWVDGNHENHTMLREVYGPGGSRHKLTPEGFWEIRPGVYYIPRGTRWVWNDVHLMGLGGAYSVDKWHRLREEKKRREDTAVANRERAKVGAPQRPYDPTRHQAWWPEEELTVTDITTALADSTPIDILFTHDKPRGSNPAWNRKDIADCHPNQDKISTVVNTLTPKLLVHGHLHFRYRDTIPCGDDGKTTRVEGLSCNVSGREDTRDNDPETAWLLIHLVDEPVDNDIT